METAPAYDGVFFSRLIGCSSLLCFFIHGGVLGLISWTRGVYKKSGSGGGRGFGFSAICAAAGFGLDLLFIFFERGGLLARWCSYCVRYRGFYVGLTFYFL